MKYDEKQTTHDEENQQTDDSLEQTQEALDRPVTMHEGEETPSQASQRVSFSQPEQSDAKEDQIERALEDENAQFRREDKETNKSEDPRIGTHDRD
ncbi:MAG: hypothetical protein R3338_06765 [Thermoanaerobaculia bacterium]|nr:hypothetical protein [Thermoanaerobaculia bacterium]